MKKIFKALWSLINFSRLLILNVIFFALLFVFVVAINERDNVVPIANNNALILDLDGQIVEQKQYVEPADEFLSNVFGDDDRQTEFQLDEIISVIKKARDDDQITAIILKIELLNKTSLDKLQQVGRALEQFKTANKKVLAIADHYTQNQYFLASYADEIIIHPQGWLGFDGYSRYRLYLNDFLDKLKVNRHIFKVGEYKSAIEPLIRQKMSEPAKEANLAWLQELWTIYTQEVSQRRDLKADAFDQQVESLVHKLEKHQFQVSQFALEYGFVDSVKTREEVREYLVDLVGKNTEHSFNKIHYHRYLDMTQQAINPHSFTAQKIGLVIAQGVISDGYRKAGQIGGDSTSALLRKARTNPQIKAVVLRIDSPGGSAFASDLIRAEVDLLKQAGKPVIVSMGGYAASGGYWIAAAADEIWAAPTTLTGSIGVFGFFPTFEHSLAALGINVDGVATSDLAGLSPLRPLNPELETIIHRSTERVYELFLELVATHRDMSIEQVNDIAQGRVWIGKKAHQLGLVDYLGGLDDAIKSAAKLASLDHYDVKVIEQELSEKERLLKEILSTVQAVLPTTWQQQLVSKEGSNHSVQQLLQLVQTQWQWLTQMNDPQHTYVICTQCQ